MDHIIVGVDTHKANHIAVAINGHGARLGTITIPATRKGYANLQDWASRLGHIRAFGIEGTGSYGAGLSRELLAHGHTVLDVMRPNRQLRYLHGKSDSLDAESAARSVLNGQATALAKAQTGSSEMIRHIKVARDSAIKAKSQAMITLRTLIINAPSDLRARPDQRANRLNPPHSRVSARQDPLAELVGESCHAGHRPSLVDAARRNRRART